MGVELNFVLPVDFEKNIPDLGCKAYNLFKPMEIVRIFINELRIKYNITDVDILTLNMEEFSDLLKL
jgi:hypothetical protein